MALDLSIYAIDYSKVTQRLTPWFWRYPVFLSYLNAIMAPLQTDNAIMASFTTLVWNKLQYTGQHLALEELLNDAYDNVSRRIFIDENNVTSQSIDLYKSGETDPSPISLYKSGEANPSPISLYKSTEGTGGFNFTVNIPVSIAYNEDVLRSQLDFFVLAGKNYNIVTF